MEKTGQPYEQPRWSPVNEIPAWIVPVPFLSPINEHFRAGLTQKMPTSSSTGNNGADPSAGQARSTQQPDQDAEQIAVAAVATWRNVDSTLAPVIGPQAVASLYKRSLFMARKRHPCLAIVSEATPMTGEFAPLQAVLSQQSDVEAATASHALLQIFRDLLASLVGASLADQLLPSPFGPPSSSGDAVQDTQP